MTSTLAIDPFEQLYFWHLISLMTFTLAIDPFVQFYFWH